LLSRNRTLWLVEIACGAGWGGEEYPICLGKTRLVGGDPAAESGARNTITSHLLCRRLGRSGQFFQHRAQGREPGHGDAGLSGLTQGFQEQALQFQGLAALEINLNGAV